LRFCEHADKLKDHLSHSSITRIHSFFLAPVWRTAWYEREDVVLP
jgi:hypothetical protein